MMKKENLTEEKMEERVKTDKERIEECIHNLVWNKVQPNASNSLATIKIMFSKLNYHVYYINQKFIESGNSVVQAVVNVDSKHYHYVSLSESEDCIWVFEIKESEVENNIIELRDKTCDGYELYNPELPEKENIEYQVNVGVNEGCYDDDLPF